jgi:hypothetical protein
MNVLLHINIAYVHIPAGLSAALDSDDAGLSKLDDVGFEISMVVFPCTGALFDFSLLWRNGLNAWGSVAFIKKIMKI